MNADPALLWIWPVIAAPFVGSFLGTLVLRLPAGEPIAWSRSVCRHCGHTLGVRDLAPLLSWLTLGGRCRYCSASLGAFYPAMELAAVAIALWAVAALPPHLVWVGSMLGWALLGAAVLDLRLLVLPDLLVLPLIPAGIALHWAVAPESWIDHAAGAAAGFGVFVAIGLIYRMLRGRDGLGFGDAKLLAAAGAWVSWTGLPSVVFLAALFGLGGVLAATLVRRRPDASREIPFGPCLALAAWVVWLYGPLVLA